jgi:hypothetical protein
MMVCSHDLPGLPNGGVRAGRTKTTTYNFEIMMRKPACFRTYVDTFAWQMGLLREIQPLS